jgi:dihydroflavonol-4-reductase
MTILVTGATGLLGNNVVRALLHRGETVRVLVRQTGELPPLAGLTVERKLGDVRDAESVRRACQGVSAVIHAAALVHIGWSRLREQRSINLDGTRNVAAAALAANARLVHVSTVNTLGVGRRDRVLDEESPRTGQVPCGYVVTKREAEAVVQQHIAQGLNAVIVNPAFMLGPWDWKPSSGQMLLQVARKFTPLAPTGGCTLCDVRDVADGVLAALARGESGRNYILAGHRLSYHDLWRLMAEVTGGKPPWFRAGPLMRIIGAQGGDAWGQLTGREPSLNSAAVTMSGQFHYYSSARAEVELGYRSRPVRETITDAWRWFQEHGYAQD